MRLTTSGIFEQRQVFIGNVWWRVGRPCYLDTILIDTSSQCRTQCRRHTRHCGRQFTRYGSCNKDQMYKTRSNNNSLISAASNAITKSKLRALAVTRLTQLPTSAPKCLLTHYIITIQIKYLKHITAFCQHACPAILEWADSSQYA